MLKTYLKTGLTLNICLGLAFFYRKGFATLMQVMGKSMRKVGEPNVGLAGGWIMRRVVGVRGAFVTIC